MIPMLLFKNLNMKISEKLLERKLSEEIKKIGGLALKLSSPFFTGLPDRLVLLKGGKLKFVEMKTTGKKPTEKQNAVIAFLKNLGFDVWVIDDKNTLDNFLNSCKL